ncbi:NTP transferase domain-containing protein [Isoptericola sp. BMS4]|uniref:NTP transferase domain-containing protein n=1 Tax=Isoptericola sp. BMS4 TaxID=2527875 RepID=UPI00141FAF4A|nr:NTP transferase domain-containing protein [Isoptericola sp. BMS4]
MAVVPLRDGVSGKSRLAADLDPVARRRLVADLARHVVGVLAAHEGVERVLVVTADVPFTRAALGGLARGPGDAPVDVVAQPPARPGLNAALDVGREHAAARGARRLLVAHADLPMLAADDVTAMLTTGGHRGSPGSGRQSGLPTRTGTADEIPVVVGTDRHDAGTNLLVVPATAAFRFRFGAGSRAAHEAEAARHGLAVAVVRRPGTAVDLDTLDDWGQLPDDARRRLRDAVGSSLP